jgi:NAD(P)-dependent dehydrogenase (short-subunit alcohol dehydrogenase family)
MMPSGSSDQAKGLAQEYPRDRLARRRGLHHQCLEHLLIVQPEEVAAVTAYLLSDTAAMVNGISMPTDGGFLIN